MLNVAETRQALEHKLNVLKKNEEMLGEDLNTQRYEKAYKEMKNEAASLANKFFDDSLIDGFAVRKDIVPFFDNTANEVGKAAVKEYSLAFRNRDFPAMEAVVRKSREEFEKRLDQFTLSIHDMEAVITKDEYLVRIMPICD